MMSVAAAARPSSRRSFAFAGPLDLLTRVPRAASSRAKVTDGNVTGWMRASTLGIEPPK
jgi:hypothetical protein